MGGLERALDFPGVDAGGALSHPDGRVRDLQTGVFGQTVGPASANVLASMGPTDRGLATVVAAGGGKTGVADGNSHRRPPAYTAAATADVNGGAGDGA